MSKLKGRGHAYCGQSMQDTVRGPCLIPGRRSVRVVHDMCVRGGGRVGRTAKGWAGEVEVVRQVVIQLPRMKATDDKPLP
jgi:hypothetical protein